MQSHPLTKRCPDCGRELSYLDFGRVYTNKNWPRQSACRTCDYARCKKSEQKKRPTT